MHRFKLICITIVLVIFTAIICMSCTANPNRIYPEYSIECIHNYKDNSLSIYKVKTPSKTYTICTNKKGGIVVLQ